MHFAGSGVGGHCLPKDPWLLKYGVDTYGKFKTDPQIIVKSRHLNMKMPHHVIDLLKKALNKTNIDINSSKIAILGVAFLENSDDTRNTPTKTLYEGLKETKAKIILHDPYVRDFEIPFTDNLDETITNSDAIIIMTKHKEYTQLDLQELYKMMKTPIIIDGRDTYSKQQCEQIGFTYYGVGKPH